MIRYHPTNGPNGEVLVDWDGNFVGFIARLGEERQWAAFSRDLDLIGDHYGSDTEAARACWNRSLGFPRIPVDGLAKALR